MITIIDSGIGGLSIYNQVRRRLPKADILYFGDTAYMPYGNKTNRQIYCRMKYIIKRFEKQTDLFVIACNSATVSMIKDYRLLSSKPFVGIEPGIKPAAKVSKTKKIAVLATSLTIKSPQIPHLIKKFGQGCQFYLIACKGLAEMIEKAPKKINNALKCADKIPQKADTVVLACTHYNLIADKIQKRVGQNKKIIDVSPAVAKQVERIYKSKTNFTNKLHRQSGRTEFICSGDKQQFHHRVKKIIASLPLS